MKTCILILVFLQTLYAQELTPYVSEAKSEKDARMEWWSEARFGLFIHWGLYAIPAGEWGGKTNYGEWIRHSAQIPVTEYDRFLGRFNPVKFDANEWVRMAKEAGMKYIVITSKHHDGFCLFDSRYTDFDVMSTPFHRDIMKELADACHRQRIKICWYHSIMDWHHPDYLPRRPWENNRPAEGADFNRYVSYLKNELRELLTKYGDIGVLWFDGEWEPTWNTTYGSDLYRYVRSLQPGIIINNRVHAEVTGDLPESERGYGGGDFGTPEQEIPSTGLPGIDWETCMTMNDHWGYNKYDKHFKPASELLRMLADISSKGGNYLLNVGPTAEGLFPQESVDRLKEIGRWMRINGESIYGTTASPFRNLEWGRCTQRPVSGGTRLYLHIFQWPPAGTLAVRGIYNEPRLAYLLSDSLKRPLAITRKEDALVISLPPDAPDSINSIVVLDVEGKPDISEAPLFSSENTLFIDTLHVGVTSVMGNTEVRYTLDGSPPSIDSDVADRPVVIDGTTTITARCFRNGKPVSAVSHATFTKVTPRPSMELQRPADGIKFRYAEGDWDVMPSFATIKVVEEGALPNFSLPPGKRSEYFGVEYRGYARIPSDGVYTFYLSSDDGSRLFIGDELIVDNDSLHGMLEKNGSVALAAGYHPLRLEYFQKTGDVGLRVSYKCRSFGKIPVPDSILVHQE